MEQKTQPRYVDFTDLSVFESIAIGLVGPLSIFVGVAYATLLTIA